MRRGIHNAPRAEGHGIPVGRIRLVGSGDGLAALIWQGENYQRMRRMEPERKRSAPALFDQMQEVMKHQWI